MNQYAKICYGVAFDEEAEFPWDADEYDGDPEEWWFSGVQGFRPTFELSALEGNWIGGEDVEAPQERFNQYYRERREFRESHPPLPVELVEHCRHDWPMYILAAPGTYRWAHRGSPVGLSPAANLVGFCVLMGN